MPHIFPRSLNNSFTVLLYSISGLLYYHCFFFLSMTEDCIAIYDHCNVFPSLIFKCKFSLLKRIFLPVPIYQYQYLSICTSTYHSGHLCCEVSFCFHYCSAHHYLVILAGRSDPLLLMLPFKPTTWTTAKTAC